MHEDLLTRRNDYPILADRTYLVSNSLGAMHRDSPAGLARYSELWASRGVTAWGEWFPAMGRIADLVGVSLGADPGTTILRATVADALGAVISCLRVDGPRRRVVCSAGDWPGSHYAWRRWAEQTGGEVVVVPLEDDGVTPDADRIAAVVDDNTVAVSVSVVQFRTAAVVDLDPIVAAARSHGALLIADAYQAAGAVPVEVARRGVDVCVGGSVKYLSGGPGNGWLSVRSGLVDELHPAAVGWISHSRPFDFVFDDIDYAGGIGRFAGGTPNVPAAFAAEAGYRAVAEIGIEVIRERSISLTQPMLEDALDRGLTVNSPVDPQRRGGHVTIDPAPGDIPRAAAIAAGMIERGVVIDHRPGSGIRIAPHFYNTAEESLRALEVMAEVSAVLR